MKEIEKKSESFIDNEIIRLKTYIERVGTEKSILYKKCILLEEENKKLKLELESKQVKPINGRRTK